MTSTGQTSGYKIVSHSLCEASDMTVLLCDVYVFPQGGWIMSSRVALHALYFQR